MSRKTQPEPDGFTVIEIIIVLAIAALILLIVFLAVPALQRNSRNYRRRRDASTIAVARQEADQNIRYTGAFAPAAVWSCTPGFTPGSACDVIQSDGLSYYDLANVTIYYNPFNAPPPVVPTVPDLDHIISANYLNCNSSNTGATTNASEMDAVILFDIETASGPQTQCLQTNVYNSTLQ